jgi:hypothetical protein
MARHFGFGTLRVRLVCSGIVASALGICAPAVAQEHDAQAQDEWYEPEADPSGEAAPHEGYDIEAELEEEARRANEPDAPTEPSEPTEPSGSDASSVLLPSKHAAKYGRRPLAPLVPAESYRPKLQRRSPGMMAAGIALTSLGGVTALVGGALLATSANQRSHDDLVSYGWETDSWNDRSIDDSGSSHDAKSLHRAGTGTLLVGLGALAAGIPLIVVGARKIPLYADSASLTLSPTGGVLRVSF